MPRLVNATSCQPVDVLKTDAVDWILRGDEGPTLRSSVICRTPFLVSVQPGGVAPSFSFYSNPEQAPRAREALGA